MKKILETGSPEQLCSPLEARLRALSEEVPLRALSEEARLRPPAPPRSHHLHSRWTRNSLGAEQSGRVHWGGLGGGADEECVGTRGHTQIQGPGALLTNQIRT